jgi:predicted Zn-dependent peptidase
MKLDLDLRCRTLGNGLRVVVSPDRSAPVFGLTVLYEVGSREEPRRRAGFAHLFEHLMFDGTPRAPKGVFDQVCDAAGGSNNGQTRPDVTVYVEAAPVSALDRFLWLEADRMTSLALDQETLDTERDVVKEEIRFNVQDDPYGMFEFQELQALLFDRWANAHDGYGDFSDLDRATLADIRSFFGTYYRPGNAVVSIAGDVDPEEVFDRAERHFGSIPSGRRPKRPDLEEGRRKTAVLAVREAPLARTPALVAGWRTPPRGHEDAWPLLLLGELLHDGRTARLYRGLVEGRELAADVSGGFNPFQGGCWYHGSTLFLSRIAFRGSAPHEEVLGALDEEIARVAAEGVDEAELARLKTKLVASFLRSLESRLDLSTEAAVATAFDGDPSALLAFPEKVSRVAAGDLARAAGRWLAPSARAAIVKVPPARGRR